MIKGFNQYQTVWSEQVLKKVKIFEAKVGKKKVKAL
jgi:methionyl-tRNA formyltransferase